MSNAVDWHDSSDAPPAGPAEGSSFWNAIRVLVLGICVCAHCGCTAIKLKTSVVNQVRTLTDLQYSQVLSNLAMFYQNMDAIPCQVALHDGSTQIGDSGLASLFFDAGEG